MGTYFHGSSEIQAADGMQTLYLMNPTYVPFSDTTPHQSSPATNMLFLNPAGHALSPSNLAYAPPSNHLIGVPLSSNMGPATTSDDPCRPSSQYYSWGSIDENSTQIGGSSGPHDIALLRRHPPLSSPPHPPVVSPTRQGLSLTLSSTQQQHVPYRSSNYTNVELDQMQGQSGNSPSSISVVTSNGISGMQSVVLGSKYLTATQELLDEVVNVGKGIITKAEDQLNEGIMTKGKMKIMNMESTAVITREGSSSGGDQNDSLKFAADQLTTAQKQELQMKKAKLVNMLEEVEQRYKQYHNQMQMIASSFEQAAGFGSAKSYTALALQTISKQFRCLKDAISSQIKATTKSLGEEDCLGAKVESSRLRYVDHQLRQQRALQHLGMIQHNAWRPQRGLPERAVSVLRAWLFEHFLHPYPKDSDKHVLAKQTGLTRSQVSNWFINARVRLWKPMVEEMYLEEIEEKERKGSKEINTSSKNEHKKEFSGSKSTTTPQETSSSILMDQVNSFEPKPEKSTNLQNPSPTDQFSNPTLQQQTGFNLIRSSDMEGVLLAHRSSSSPKKQRSNEMKNSRSSIVGDHQTSRDHQINIAKFGGERLTKDGYPLILTDHNGGGFGTTNYPIGDIGRFTSNEQLTPRFHGNGGVSLTLGLPHCENNLSLSGNQQNFLSNQNIQLGRRLQLGNIGEPDFCGINNTQQRPTSHGGTGYENIDIHNRKRFAAQLLPDFVA